VGALMAIVDRAEAAGVACAFHHGGGGLAAYAHLHLAAGAADSPWFEIIRDRPGEIPWPAQLAPLVPLGIDAVGEVRVPDAPGLGVDLDEAFLDRFTASRTVIDSTVSGTN
jgi:L-alanine-DL-glutamate epimerase-like enolase superfamily enzyme